MNEISKALAYLSLNLILLSGITATFAQSTWTGNTNTDWNTDGKFELSKVIEVDVGSPMNYELSQNYPNPFNPSTTIRFSLLESNPVNLSIFNSLGEKVEEVVNEVKEPGVHTIEFSAQDLPSGTYFYRIQVNGFTQIKKMILLK